MNTTRFLRAVKIEGCNAIGAIIVLMWLAVFALWKIDLIGKEQGHFIVWIFQMGFSGAIYMALMPVTRFTINVPLKVYHWVSLVAGLLVGWYAGMQLSIADMLDFRNVSFLVILAVPTIIVLPCVWLYTTTQEQNGVAKA